MYRGGGEGWWHGPRVVLKASLVLQAALRLTPADKNHAVYIYIYMYMYTYVYICICIHVYRNVVRTYVHIDRSICVCTNHDNVCIEVSITTNSLVGHALGTADYRQISNMR